MRTIKKSLHCSECGTSYPIDAVNSYCAECNSPLIVKYHLPFSLKREDIEKRSRNMWRYFEMLPLYSKSAIVSLGEGWTPLLRSKRLGKKLGLDKLWIKDESGNPTGSFKARGLSMAVSRGIELGLKAFAIPTAGNAGSSLSAYCAKAGAEAHVYMPEDTPDAFKMDCSLTGADVHFVDGNISDCAAELKRENVNDEWFDVSTMKEPYRLEGKKTMGYEIAEQMGWSTPDVILYPTGGGTGLIGIWKAFKEMQELGWINKINTRMIAVQVEGCAPVVRAFRKGLSYCKAIANPIRTIANGLRVPKPFGDKMLMRTLYESGGFAVEVSDQEIREGVAEVAATEGLLLCPEGAACWAALKKLKAKRLVQSFERIVILNTGSGYKYLEYFKRAITREP